MGIFTGPINNGFGAALMARRMAGALADPGHPRSFVFEAGGDAFMGAAPDRVGKDGVCLHHSLLCRVDGGDDEAGVPVERPRMDAELASYVVSLKRSLEEGRRDKLKQAGYIERHPEVRLTMTARSEDEIPAHLPAIPNELTNAHTGTWAYWAPWSSPRCDEIHMVIAASGEVYVYAEWFSKEGIEIYNYGKWVPL